MMSSKKFNSRRQFITSITGMFQVQVRTTKLLQFVLFWVFITVLSSHQLRHSLLNMEHWCWGLKQQSSGGQASWWSWCGDDDKVDDDAVTAVVHTEASSDSHAPLPWWAVCWWCSSSPSPRCCWMVCWTDPGCIVLLQSTGSSCAWTRDCSWKIFEFRKIFESEKIFELRDFSVVSGVSVLLCVIICWSLNIRSQILHIISTRSQDNTSWIFSTREIKHEHISVSGGGHSDQLELRHQHLLLGNTIFWCRNIWSWSCWHEWLNWKFNFICLTKV